MSDYLIVPVFLPQKLTGKMYCYFLEETLHELLKNVPLTARIAVWFMHDGLPPRFLVARDF